MHPFIPYIIILLTYARLSSFTLISPMYVGSLVGSLLGTVGKGVGGLGVGPGPDEKGVGL